MGKAVPKPLAKAKPSDRRPVQKSKRVLKRDAVVKKRKPYRGDGFYSGRHQPRNTVAGRKLIQNAVKAGSIVLEIDGHFKRVAMNHKVRFTAKRSALRSGALTRYGRYAQATTLRDAFLAGASHEDVVFHVRRGTVEWLPTLHCTKAKGPLQPSEWPPGIREDDRRRPFWLPDDWAQGVKTTCKTYLPVYIAPNGKTYYHRPVIEKIVNRQLGGLEGMREHAAKCLREGVDWAEEKVTFDADAQLFQCLTKQERACLPAAEELHFCVVSARRASERTGIRGIVNVQTRLVAAGARPRWYVDEASREDYKKLGLDAVVGGKLTPSRNKALDDAAKKRKACVQISDDITRWEYHKGDLKAICAGDGASEKLQKANAAAKSKNRLIISPVAAARFLLAKMRASELRPQLGGVYPVGNAALGLLCEAVSTEAFILGDFFVHDKSPCRFDESITLKEDYDFTCSHLDRHGSVLRCNRLIVSVAHETNPGGAVAERDAKGKKEHQNIAILMRKWPGVFKPHGTRGDTQVTMRWSRRQLS